MTVTRPGMDMSCILWKLPISGFWGYFPRLLQGAMLVSRVNRMLFCWLFWVLVIPPVVGGNWPQFRGPNGSGVAVGGDYPVFFGPESNVVWKTAIPAGNSSPCVWGKRIFLTGQTGAQLETLCLDGGTGAILWRKFVEIEKWEKGMGGAAAPTPATDGERVYVYFGPFGAICYDFEGREIWRKKLLAPVTQHGVGASPVVANGRLYLARDGDVDSHLLALNAQDGAVLWKTDRPEFRRGFSTPLLWPEARPELLILPGTLRMVAYEVSGGRERWRVGGLPNEMVASPVFGDGLVFAAGWTPGAGASKLPDFDALLAQGDLDKDGRLTRDETPQGPARQQFFYSDANKDGFLTREEWDSITAIFGKSENALLAVRPDASMPEGTSRTVWKQTRGLPYVPTPLYLEGRVYTVKNGGLFSCYDARTGKIYYQEERLGALGDYYASPVAGGGKIYCVSQPGTVVVIKAGDALEVLARNSFKEPVMATPALVDGRIYLRTQKHLYALGK